MRTALLLSFLLVCPILAQAEGPKKYPWNALLIIPKTGPAAKGKTGDSKGGTLSLRDAQLIAAQCQPDVGSVAPIIRGREFVAFEKKSWVPLYIYGPTPSFLDVRQWQDLQQGTPFT